MSSFPGFFELGSEAKNKTKFGFWSRNRTGACEFDTGDHALLTGGGLGAAGEVSAQLSYRRDSADWCQTSTRGTL